MVGVGWGWTRAGRGLKEKAFPGISSTSGVNPEGKGTEGERERQRPDRGERGRDKGERPEVESGARARGTEAGVKEGQQGRGSLRPTQGRVLGRHKARSQGPHLLEPGGLLGYLHLGCQATADPAPHPGPGAGPARTALGLPWWPEGNITGCWDGLSQGVGLAVPTPTPGESAWKAQQGPGQQALRPENRRPLSPGDFLLPQGRLLGPAHPLLWPRKGNGAASQLHARGFLGESPWPPTTVTPQGALLC